MLEGTLPKSIDTKRLDSGETRFEGTVPLAALRRLRDLVLTPEAKVRAVIEIRREAGACVTVTGTVETRVRLECQRCLQPKEILLQAPFQLLAVGSAAEAEVLAGRSDPLVAPNGVIDLLITLEDELLLALPPVPMHESNEACGQRNWRFGPPEAVDAAVRRRNPFAVLEQLKNKGD
ncbi:MAG TPA: YceD family protein [Nitrococcus sp.]|nr:YceD family protein [Nitrococcus sp.]